MHPMHKLLVSNRQRGKFYAAAKPEADEATLYLYDMIVNSDDEAEFFGGVSPQAFIKALNEITAKTIHLRVNSPGGSVFAARAIEQAIREHGSQIIAHVDGVAASAASFLIMAADSIEMAPGAFIMIHKAWSFGYGNADELRKHAALLEQIDGSLVKTYAKRTAQQEAEISAWMADETWFDADRAVSLGFADRVAEDSESNAAIEWDLQAYSHAPIPAATKAEPVKSEKPAESNTVDREAMRRAALKALIPA